MLVTIFDPHMSLHYSENLTKRHTLETIGDAGDVAEEVNEKQIYGVWESPTMDDVVTCICDGSADEIKLM